MIILTLELASIPQLTIINLIANLLRNVKITLLTWKYAQFEIILSEVYHFKMISAHRTHKYKYNQWWQFAFLRRKYLNPDHQKVDLTFEDHNFIDLLHLYEWNEMCGAFQCAIFFRLNFKNVNGQNILTASTIIWKKLYYKMLHWI